MLAVITLLITADARSFTLSSISFSVLVVIVVSAETLVLLFFSKDSLTCLAIRAVVEVLDISRRGLIPFLLGKIPRSIGDIYSIANEFAVLLHHR